REQAGRQNPGYTSRYDRGPSWNGQERWNGQQRLPQTQRYPQGSFTHPVTQAYNRPPDSMARLQQYNRSAPSYGSGFYGNSGINRGYQQRPGSSGYSNAPVYRAPNPAYGRESQNQFSARSNPYG